MPENPYQPPVTEEVQEQQPPWTLWAVAFIGFIAASVAVVTWRIVSVTFQHLP
jgi:hypothetical protein